MDFLKVGEVDPGALGRMQLEVFRNYKLFDEFTVRQEYAGTAHGNTKTIPLRLGKSLTPDTKVEDLTPAIMLDEMEMADWDNSNLFVAAERFIAGFNALHNFNYCGWVTITTLKAGGEVTPHTDDGEYCKVYTRFHLCLYGSSTLTVAGIDYEINEGDIIAFDNQKTHSVKNPNNNERINLIFDLK